MDFNEKKLQTNQIWRLRLQTTTAPYTKLFILSSVDLTKYEKGLKIAIFY